MFSDQSFKMNSKSNYKIIENLANLIWLVLLFSYMEINLQFSNTTNQFAMFVMILVIRILGLWERVPLQVQV